jgi:hypothetical protein
MFHNLERKDSTIVSLENSLLDEFKGEALHFKWKKLEIEYAELMLRKNLRCSRVLRLNKLKQYGIRESDISAILGQPLEFDLRYFLRQKRYLAFNETQFEHMCGLEVSRQDSHRKFFEMAFAKMGPGYRNKIISDKEAEIERERLKLQIWELSNKLKCKFRGIGQEKEQSGSHADENGSPAEVDEDLKQGFRKVKREKNNIFFY